MRSGDARDTGREREQSARLLGLLLHRVTDCPGSRVEYGEALRIAEKLHVSRASVFNVREAQPSKGPRKLSTLGAIAKAFDLPDWLVYHLGGHALEDLLAEGRCSRPDEETLTSLVRRLDLRESDAQRLLATFEPWIGHPSTASSGVIALAREIEALHDAVKPVSHHRLRELSEREREALRLVLLRAEDPELRALWDRPLPPRSGFDRASGLPSFAREVLAILGDFRRGARDPATLDRAVVDAVRALSGLGAEIPYDAWGLSDALFAEQLLGLGHVEIMCHVPRTARGQWQEILAESVAQAVDTDSHVAGLVGALSLNESLLRAVNARFGEELDDSEALWAEIREAFYEATAREPALEVAIRTAVSLRSGPVLPPTATLSQCAHWLGWGGDGKLFEGLRRSSAALLRRVHSEKSFHAFNWHAVETGSRMPTRSFRGRQRHFSNIAERLAERAARCAAALADHPALRRDHDETLRLWADAVGPTARAERRIHARLSDLRARRGAAPPSIHAVLTEVSPSSLRKLTNPERDKHPVELRSPKVLVRDLQRPFPGEPGVAIRDDLRDLLKIDAYDVYSCSVAAHQIADRASGLARLRALFGFAVRLVRPGGVLSMPDVGPGGHLQVYLLPANVSDREGGYGPSTFFDEQGFLGVAIADDGAPFDPESPASHYKIPLPLLDLRHGTPECLDRDGLAIYEVCPHLVVRVPTEQLLALDRRFRRPGSEPRPVVIRRALSELGYPQLQANVRRQVDAR